MKTKVSFEVEIDLNWIDVCVRYNDLFFSQYCGYWMRGMEKDNKLGWLCYEFEYSNSAPTPFEVVESPEYKRILKAWRKGDKLPEHWHRLDKQMAIKAWQEGVKKYGIDWYQNADSTTYDVVIQMALLGSIVYG